MIILQLIAMVWVILMIPIQTTQLFRAIAHDRGYSLGYEDILTAGSIVFLLLTGLPPLGVL